MSKVEKIFINKSGYEVTYAPQEKQRLVVVDNFPELGRLTALRFLEWVQNNPGGVISLPTGKTPEHFIKWVKYYLQSWNGEASADLKASGIAPSIKPDMKSLHFVQMDEFYPIDSNRHNSFCNYVRKFYIEGFGLDAEKALVIDCNTIGLQEGQSLRDIWFGDPVDLTLRNRNPKNEIEAMRKVQLAKVDAWCDEYERRISEKGGIGFFLGGIGPDGHIAFNIRGSSHYSRTRLLATNYETQAAAAGDLGGIEVAGTKPVITIGLATITQNPAAVAIIMAAGEAKAAIVANAITNEPNPQYPATALQKLPNAVFFLTKGAAKLLQHRQLVDIGRLEISPPQVWEKACVDLSLKLNKPIKDLSNEEIRTDATCATLLAKAPHYHPRELRATVINSLISKIDKGGESRSANTFLHTEPHHDDIMLGYQPALVRDLHDPETSHYFATLTSGFTAVTNNCLRQRVRDTIDLLREGQIAPIACDEQVHQFVYGLAAKNKRAIKYACAHRFLDCLQQVFKSKTNAECMAKLDWILEYIESGYSGKKDIPEIQFLKGSMREWEIETLWGAFGIPTANISHLRLGFYQGDIFTEEPTSNRDVPPIIDLLKEIRPSILTVAFDPEASGPDTHYKVLQAIAAAIRQLQIENSNNLPKEIWGYRNVWYRFHPAEANMMIPVARSDLAVMHNLFMETFVTQREASFPSYEHNGPFSELAQSIQVDQYRILETCLGKDWFRKCNRQNIRAACAFVFIKRMGVNEFLQQARELRKQFTMRKL